MLEARSVAEVAAATIGRVRPLIGAMLVAVVEIDEDMMGHVLAVDTAWPLSAGAGAVVPLVGPIDDLRRGEVRRIDRIDAGADLPPSYRFAVEAGAEQLAIVPLISRGELAGALGIATTSEAPITEEKLEIAREVARSLAVALQDARREEALVASLGLLETVVAIDRAILEARSVEEVLAITLGRLRRLVPSIAVVATEVDHVARTSTVLGVDADRDLLVEPGQRLELVGNVDDLLGGRMRIVPDLAELPEPLPPAFAVALRAGARSIVVAPLFARGQWIGSLNIAHEEPGGFSADDLRLIEEVAASLAVALDNGRMLDELERAAEKLAVRVEERTAQLRAVLDSTPDSIWAFTVGGEPVVSNAPSLRFLREELGLHADVELPAILSRLAAISTDPEGWRARAADVVADPELEILDVLSIQGTRQVFSIYTCAVREGGRVAGRLLVLRDISAERQAEKAKEELLAAVSHEIRTPLTGLANAAEILATRDLPDERRERYKSLLFRETERLKALIGDFLDLQSLDRGRLVLEPTAFDLDEFVRDVVSLHAESRPGHPFELEGDPAPVVADRDRIAQVIGNLVTNAIKYSPDGGVVRISTLRRGNVVRVSVADRGIGLPPSERQLVFSRFFRGEGAKARGISGTGLGLALARDVVEASGGMMGFESEEGQGSVFWFELPLAGEEET